MKHLVLVTTTLALLAPAIASADDVGDHVDKGTRFYNLQDWANALKEYKQAYALDPRPETLWAIAQTQRLAGDCRSAILTYKAYARGASAAGENAAEDAIKQCQADLGARQHAVDSISAEPARPVAVASTPPTPTPPAPQPPRPWFRDPLGDTLFVAGAVGVLGGGTFFVLGELHMRDAASDPTWGGYRSATTRAGTDQAIGAIAAAGGAVCVGLAIWRFAAIKGREPDEHQPAIAIGPTSGGAFASYTTSF